MSDRTREIRLASTHKGFESYLWKGDELCRLHYDPKRRLSEYHTGHGSSACARSSPEEIISTESFRDLVSAMGRARQLKGWSRAKKRALAEGRLNALHHLARRAQETCPPI